MAFDIAFAIFAALLLVLAVFVIRFARGLSRQRGADGKTMRERAWERAQEQQRRAQAEQRAQEPERGTGERTES